ncbi:MAG: hypothetical protein K8S27_07265 [Candidatus Omnitrophica bacterium]|nr:hypothetical protein [Candidatus Omnitrophota bacterium]
MLFFTLSTLINLLVSIMVGWLVLSHNRYLPANRSLVYVVGCLSVWNVYFFCLMVSSTSDLALFAVQCVVLSCVVLPVAIFDFVIHLLNIVKENKKFSRLSMLFCLGLGLGIFFPNLVINSLRPKMMFPYFPTAGILFHAYVIYFAVIVVRCLYLLYAHSLKLTGLRRQQIRVVFWGLTMAIIGGATNLFLWYDIAIPPYGHVFIGLIPLSLSYGIIKYRLIGLQLVLKKSFVYVILITIMIAFYFFLVHIVERFLRGTVIFHPGIVPLSYVVTIAFCFIPLRDRLKKVLDEQFLRGSFFDLFQLNEKLRQEISKTDKYRSLSTLTKGIALEMKNPIATLQSYSYIFSKKIKDKKFILKFSNVLNRELQRLINMAEKLNDYSCPTPLAVRETDVNQLLKDVLETMQQDFLDKKIKVFKEIHQDPVELPLDPHQIRQVLVNIIINAVEAMPNGGKLWIGSAMDDDSFKISIKDNGCGITHEDVSQVFDPFYSLKGNNTGLGLSIAQAIIEGHRGTIGVQSEIGVGTEFIIEVPLSGE